MDDNEKQSSDAVSKKSFLLGLLIEILVCLFGFLFQAILIEIGIKYLGFTLCVIMVAYFIGRNYFFDSLSSIFLGIRWNKSKYILLKNFIYILLITVLIMQKNMVITVLAGLAINLDVVFLFVKHKWFLNDLFKLECYKKKIR